MEQNFQKYFWDLCEVGDANKDGNIDLDEWLDVMNDIIIHLKENGTFLNGTKVKTVHTFNTIFSKLKKLFEGLHKALFRANEFFGNFYNFYNSKT